MLKVFGIPNCDQVKKSQKWLKDRGIEFEFHDYKKQGITKKQLSEWCKEVEWEALLNKRSRTWKELSEKDQSNPTQSKAKQSKAKQSKAKQSNNINATEPHINQTPSCTER